MAIRNGNLIWTTRGPEFSSLTQSISSDVLIFPRVFNRIINCAIHLRQKDITNFFLSIFYIRSCGNYCLLLLEYSLSMKIISLISFHQFHQYFRNLIRNIVFFQNILSLSVVEINREKVAKKIIFISSIKKSDQSYRNIIFYRLFQNIRYYQLELNCKRQQK